MEPTFFYGKKQRFHSDEPDQDENTEDENETGDDMSFLSHIVILHPMSQVIQKLVVMMILVIMKVQAQKITTT